jgi:DNA-binding response OmpR family regulator
MAVRELLADVLADEGFEVVTADTAEQAELRAEGYACDVLVSDIDLPGASGARLAATLCARHPNLRVILMSGYPDDGEIVNARLQPAPVLLRKPFSTTVLVERLREVLAG